MTYKLKLLLYNNFNLMNYDINDFTYVYSKLLDLISTSLDIANILYNLVNPFDSNKLNLTINYFFYDQKLLEDKIVQNINSTIDYDILLKKECKIKLSNKLKFMREYCIKFQNDLTNLLITCIDEPINLNDLYSSSHILRVLNYCAIYYNFSKYIYDIVKSDMKLYKSKINFLSDNIKIEIKKYRENNKNIKNSKNNCLQYKLYLLTKEMIEKKIRNYEDDRINNKINFLKCKKFIKDNNYEKKEMIRYINKCKTLIIKLQKDKI
jgi:hypothetical protein